jgi:hypothetical protein
MLLFLSPPKSLFERMYERLPYSLRKTLGSISYNILSFSKLKEIVKYCLITLISLIVFGMILMIYSWLKIILEPVWYLLKLIFDLYPVRLPMRFSIKENQKR